MPRASTFQGPLVLLTAVFWPMAWWVGPGFAEPPKTPDAKRDLQAIVLTYHKFFAESNRPPRNTEELMAFEDPFAKSLPGNASAQKQVRAALKRDCYQVIWGVPIEPTAEANQGKILAYHSDVPKKGGVVCFQDGVTGILTAEEFQKARKSQPMKKD